MGMGRVSKSKSTNFEKLMEGGDKRPPQNLKTFNRPLLRDKVF